MEQAPLAESSFIEGGVNRVVMASDGDLNVGISSESELHDFVERKRETGVYLSVLGFGSGNYKDNKMETLADHGNGAYHYVDCAEEARRVLGRNLRANLVPLADDVKI
ncbi:MAG: vWA domain-containing protein, partial [Eggerthella lenta]